MRECDILVVGCGPAGLSAAQYASRAGYSVIATDALAPGGQMLYIDEIENYPGEEKTSGYALSEKMEKQAVSFGVDIDYSEVTSIEKDGKLFIAHTPDDDIKAKSVIWAAGARHRELGCNGEKEYQGKGVSYCATCDGPFFKGRDVVVVGGGDTALTDALYLSKLCSSVTLVHRRTEFRAQKVLQDRVRAKDNIKLELGKNVQSINGNGKNVESVTLIDGTEIKASAAFIFVGIIPNTEAIRDFAEMENGFIKTDSSMRTSIGGFFAAGDVRTTPFRQVVTAASDGAIAAHSADEWIQNL